MIERKKMIVAGVATAAAVLGLPHAAQASGEPRPVGAMQTETQRAELELQVGEYARSMASHILNTDKPAQNVLQRADGGVDVRVKSPGVDLVASFADPERKTIEGIKVHVDQGKTSYDLSIAKEDQDNNGVPGWRVREKSLYLKNATEGYAVDYTTEAGVNSSDVWDKYLFQAIVFEANWQLNKAGVIFPA